MDQGPVKLEYASPRRKKRDSWQMAYFVLGPLWIALFLGQLAWWAERGVMRFYPIDPADLNELQAIALPISQSPVIPIAMLLTSGVAIVGMRRMYLGWPCGRWFKICAIVQSVLLVGLVASQVAISIGSPALLYKVPGRRALYTWNQGVALVEGFRGLLFTAPWFVWWSLPRRSAEDAARKRAG